MNRQCATPYPASAGNFTRAQGPAGPSTASKIDSAGFYPFQAVISVDDYWQLQEHRRRYEQIGNRRSLYLASLIRTKSLNAKVVSFDELPEGVVTGNALVSFSTGRNRPETRSLYHWNYPTHGRGLPMRSLLGLTLIGMQAGQRAKVLDLENEVADVQVLAVHAPICQSRTACY